VERISRRRFLRVAGVGGAALLTPSWARAALLPPGATPREDSVVVRWNQALLQAVRDSKLGPPMVARALAVAHTCAYDAWAAYDRDAVATQVGDALRQASAHRTLENKEKAISFATYRAAVDLFPGSKSSVFEPLMAELGYDPSDSAGAAGVGLTCAQAVIDFRHDDASNQLNGYADTTGYTPTNTAMDLRPGAAFDPETVHDPDRWQPLRYIDAAGNDVTPKFIGPHWMHVKPFATPPAVADRGPATYGTQAYIDQARALIDFSAALTEEQKMIAEYWADGPHSELPPGHWDLFAQFVARRDRHGPSEHGIDLDVKLFFALTNAIFDAGICSWSNKRVWDSVRPITAIRYLFEGHTIRAWAGPYQGTQDIDGARWLPYQAATFPTPPFGEYSSGHSNFSAAGAEILRLFTGSDRFGAAVTFPKGSAKFEPGAVPVADLTLSWATFTEAANEAGLSRRYGGIHFLQGDLDGRATGRQAADAAWARARRYWAGTA
jgi:vanadium-dependent haloperoxidase-like protein/uncharacterized protein DUF6851